MFSGHVCPVADPMLGNTLSAEPWTLGTVSKEFEDFLFCHMLATAQ